MLISSWERLNLNKKFKFLQFIQPIANISARPTCTAPAAASQLEKQILHLEREVQEMKASLENIKEKLSSTVPAATCSPNHVGSNSWLQ